MAEETKTYLINFESNLEQYTREAAEAKKRVDELKAANQELVKSGQATAEEIERSNAALRSAETEYKNAKRAVDLTIASNKAQKNSYDALYKQWQLAQTQLKNLANTYEINQDGVRVLSAEYMKQSAAVAEAKQALDAFGKGVNDNRLNVGNYEGAAQSLRQELKNITAQMAAMQMNGERNSQAYKDLAARGGELTDTLADVKAEMKLVGSDTSSIDMAVGSFMALGSAVQVAEGTMQLFGSENEDVQRGIQKMVAIQSVLTGVQEVANSLQKESALMMGLQAAKTKAVAAAQAIYTAAVGTSTGALKIFRTALLSTGIGAIVVAIGLLISNWDKLSAMFGKSARQAKAINDEMERMQKLSEQNARTDEFRLNVLKELGALESEQTQKEIENNANRQRETFALIMKYRELMKTKKLDADQEKEFADLNAKYADLRNEYILLNIRAQNQLTDEAKKAEEERLKAAKDAAAKRKEISDQEKAAIKERIDLMLAEAKGDPEKMKAALKFQFDELSKQQGLSDAARKLLKVQYEQAITEIEREELQKRLDQQAEFQQKGDDLHQRDLAANFERQRILAGQNVDALQEILDTEFQAYKRSADYKNATLEEQALAEAQYTQASNQLSKIRQSQRDTELGAYADMLGAFSQLVGENTAAGKGFAVAQTLINTYKSATAAFAGMTEAIPGPVGIAAGIAAAAAAVAMGLANVKKILAVDPKGKSASASGGSSQTSFSLTGATQHITAQKAGTTTLTPNATGQAITTAAQTSTLTAEDIATAVAKNPPPVVTVEDINAKVDASKKVTVAANI